MRFLLRFRYRGAADHLPIWNFGPIGRTNLYFNTTGNACDRTIPPPVIDPISDDRRGRFEPSYRRARKEQNFGPISRGSDISGLPQAAHCARSDFAIKGVGDAGLSGGLHQPPRHLITPSHVKLTSVTIATAAKLR